MINYQTSSVVYFFASWGLEPVQWVFCLLFAIGKFSYSQFQHFRSLNFIMCKSPSRVKNETVNILLKNMGMEEMKARINIGGWKHKHLRYADYNILLAQKKEDLAYC